MLRKSESAFWVILVVALLAGSAKVSVARSPTHYSVDSEFYPQLQLFGEVLQRVRSDYVEKPNDSKLIEAAINGMLSSLDPHSYYLNPRELREMQVQTSGEFGGLGLEVTMEDGVIKVVSPIDGTPAARAGVQSGDVITSLDKKPIGGLTLQEAVDKMRGPPRAPVTLTIVRKGVDHPIDVKLVRGVIHVIPVKYQAEDDVGYIYITSFNEQTTADLQKAVKALKRQIGPKLKGYIVDLRNDPGGLLDQAIGVADALLDQGTIVITKGREEMQRSEASPGEKNWNCGCVCVIYDLREAIEPFREHRIVPMDENEHLAPSGRAHSQLSIEGFDEAPFAIEIRTVAHNEICHRVAWGARRPFNLARHMRWWHSHRQSCVVDGLGSFTTEIRSWSRISGTSRCHKDGVILGSCAHLIICEQCTNFGA